MLEDKIYLFFTFTTYEVLLLSPAIFQKWIAAYRLPYLLSLLSNFTQCIE